MPIVAVYILGQRRSGEALTKVALDIRTSKEARSFRKTCADFDLAARVGATSEMYAIKKDIERAASRLRDKYKQPITHVGIEFPLSISLPVPSIDLSELVAYVRNRRKYHLMFIDRLYEEALKSRGLWDDFLRFT
jgi:hypothetical protein